MLKNKIHIIPMNFSKILFFASAILLLTNCSKPISKFTIQTPDGKVAPAPITVENQSQKAQTYEWDFGDGTRSNDPNPTHEYKSSGDFTIKLKAKTGNRSRTSEQRIHIDPPSDCLVEIETEFGTMRCILFNSTPLHRDNFLKITDDGTLSGTIFHRVINGFMIQGGDPSSKTAAEGQSLGFGDLGYTVPAEFVDSLVHIKGALCAARTDNPQKRSSASQFYIVQGRPTDDRMLEAIEAQGGFRYGKEQRAAYKALGGTPFLDRNYTVFGRVIKGIDIIDKIATVQTAPGDRPVKNIVIKVKVIK